MVFVKIGNADGVAHLIGGPTVRHLCRYIITADMLTVSVHVLVFVPDGAYEKNSEGFEPEDCGND